MTPSPNIAQLFEAELPSADPVRLALAIARIAFPDLEPEHYLMKLDEMASQIAPLIAESAPGGARALALVQAMRLELEMHGNTEHYYDAANSFLNLVLDRRTGLPIMLSLILVAIGQRLGLVVEGAGFPGHFMARYEDEQGVWFLDAFHGAVMTAEDVPAYFMKLFGQSVINFDERYFSPVAATDWAQRILNNLHAVYINAGELTMLAKVLPLMLVLEPERQELWHELGLVEYRRGELTQAARALRRFFYLQGHLVLSAPNATLPPATPALDGPTRQLWELLEEIEAARIRWN
jgi:regulator of sirC expression with transglutaminase-like and TPR domain